MPKIDGWKSIEAKQPSEHWRIPAGAYVCEIERIKPEETKNGNTVYNIVFDIADGEFAGYYHDDFYDELTFLHSYPLYVSSETAISISKAALQAITDSNDGFDADAAFVADKFDMFCGKRVGVVLRDEEYETKEGNIRTSPRANRLIAAENVATTNYKPKVKTLNNGLVDYDTYYSTPASVTVQPTTQADDSASTVDDGIPF